MKAIAIVGRPNVGKSSLFNILTKSKKALVGDMPGLTRDRHYEQISINNSDFLIIDTGGLDDNNLDKNIGSRMAEQTEIAIDESDYIFFIVDARVGRHPYDNEIAGILRKKNKPVLLIINKTEGLDSNLLLNEFKRLGFNQQIFISTSHNLGIDLISDYLTKYCEVKEKILKKKKIKIAILGKPNVGKSTLINTIIGENRFIAYDQPGTTRDSVSTDFIYKGNEVTIIDTAGIRRKGKVTDKIEKFSLLKSILSISESDVCLLVINSDEGFSTQDLQILGYVIDAGKPVALGINKWDLLDSYGKDVFKKNIMKKKHFFHNFEFFYISALQKKRNKFFIRWYFTCI